MDRNVYEDQLSIDIGPFKSAIEKAIRVFEELSKTIDSREGTPIMENIAREANKAVDDIERVKAMIEGLKTSGLAEKSGFVSERDMFRVGEAIEQMTGYLNEATASTTETTEEMKNLGAETQQVDKEAKKVDVSFKGIPKTLKTIGLSILGVRSAFALFRKVVNSALSNNIELSNKFSAIWTALGNAIAPLLTRIANAILTAFSYLNLFIKALTGVDLLARGMAQANANTKATTKSVKELNKQLAGFDELNNLDTQGGGAGGDAGLGIADAFKDININTEWAEKIQAFGEWCRENWPLITGAVLGSVLAFSKLFDGFKLIEKVGIVLMFAGLFEIIKGISDFIEGVFNDDLALIVKGLGEIVVGIGLVALGWQLLMGTLTGGASLIIAGIIALGALIIKHKDEIARGLKLFWENVKAGFAEGKENIKNMVSRVAEWFRNRIERIKGFFANLRDKSVEIAGNMSAKIGEKWEGLKNGFKGIINSMIGMVEGFVNKAISGINWLIRRLNKIRFDIPDWIPLIGGKTFGFNLTQLGTISLPRLDAGTNYVPNDQLAMIHKGEAVIPKKFNSSEYFNNDDVLEKLDRFMEIVEDIDFNTYLDGKKVSKEVTRYQRQQERIMGGAY